MKSAKRCRFGAMHQWCSAIADDQGRRVERHWWCYVCGAREPWENRAAR